MCNITVVGVFRSLLLGFTLLQMIVPFSPLWSYFLLFTVVHVLYSVVIVLKMCYIYISEEFVICIYLLILCMFSFSFMTPEFQSIEIYSF